jgi:hypothetical protein
MLLSDMGAEVVSIARPGQGRRNPRDFVNRGRKVVELDLKNADHLAQALDLIAAADVLIEGFRPQVMERLGLGPEAALKRNPRLVYASGRARWRRPPATTSTTSPSPARWIRSAPATARPCRRSTSSATTAAARSISWSACSRR